MPRAQKPTGKSRHDPLHVQLEGDEAEAKYGRIAKAGKRRKSQKSSGDNEEDDEVIFVLLVYNDGLSLYEQVILDPKTSKRIFELARDQQQELGLHDEDEEDEPDASSAFQRPRMDRIHDDDEESDEDDMEDLDEEVEEIFVCANPRQ